MNSPGAKARPQRSATGYMRPSLLITGASSSRLDSRAPSKVADISRIFSGGSSRSNSRPLRLKARARSASRERS
jgi:hypothetical protein